jgi:hypothetical protein
MSATLREEHPIRNFLRSSFEDPTSAQVKAMRKVMRMWMPFLIIFMVLLSFGSIGLHTFLALVFLEEYLRVRTGWPFLNTWGARIIVIGFICILAGFVLASFGTLYLLLLPGIVIGWFVYFQYCYHKWKLELEKRTCIETNAK